MEEILKLTLNVHVVTTKFEIKFNLILRSKLVTITFFMEQHYYQGM